MIISMLIQLINIATQAVILLVIVAAILSYFMSPYHQVRQTIDRIVDPMLAPIRRVVPLVGSIDFSPVIFIILVQIVSGALVNFLYALR